jgi:putative membrane protein
MTFLDLPALNAVLNSLATIFLAVGWYFIRDGQKKRHIVCMVSALIASTVFLVGYVTWHGYLVKLTGQGHVPFTGQGMVRPLYFAILFSHLIGAFLIAALVPMTVSRALRQRFDRHRRIGRWTMPIWIYVSITGVLVYLMNYQWFPSSHWQTIQEKAARELPKA